MGTVQSDPLRSNEVEQGERAGTIDLSPQRIGPGIDWIVLLVIQFPDKQIHQKQQVGQENVAAG